MKQPQPVVLKGRSVHLKPLSIGHVDALWEVSEPQIWEFALAPMSTRGEVEAYVHQALAAQAAGLALPFVQIRADGGQVMGSTRFGNICVLDSRMEIGWTWLNPRYWGSRVNTEAKYLMLSHAFEVLGALRVEFKGDALNIRSRMALEKLGATFEGVLRQHMRTASGRQRDSFYYSILAAEWPTVKTTLEGRLAG